MDGVKEGCQECLNSVVFGDIELKTSPWVLG